ncbi:MAG: hypothetical protein HY233_00820 [Acidobacteriales bacterium]|nr:hypothetical protein [Candidatus Koribacter versatilis]MBI3644501.1 hypothetical protein [Terriglobales bacterium]
MPRMIDLIRKSQMSSNLMHAAARGALMVQPGEMMEILVHLALHNKVFGELARMTLAGWDEKASLGVAADPATHREVLGYMVSPKNLRPALLPALLENPSVGEEELAELAATGSREVIEVLVVSARVKNSPALAEALRSNPRMRAHELMATADLADPVEIPEPAPEAEVGGDAEAAAGPVGEAAPEAVATPEATEDPETADEEVLAQAIAHYLQENAAELAVEGDKPFQPVRMMHEGTGSEGGAEVEAVAAAEAEPTEAKPAAAATAKPIAAAGHTAKRPGPPSGDERRDSTLQKIAKLDIKGRIALAMRGTKEERSLLIRDGTKLVALSVLDSPKVSDGEVENFAQQKNVLEAVLRAIPLKRRFVKNYAVVRNLVYNPRTPLDLSLGLMKNLLIHDLKNLSGNKEVADTIRKLALRMFRQKTEKKKE